jgi:hypothetical protein
MSGATPPRRVRGNIINTANPTSCLPAAVQAILQPSLVPGETRHTYADLLTAIAPTDPNDVIAWVLAKSLVDATYDLLRLHRAKAGRIARVVEELLSATLCGSLEARGGCPSRSPRRAEGLLRRWRRGDPRSVREVDRLLEEAGVNLDVLLGEAFRQEIELLRALEHLTSLAESRRRSILKEASCWSAGLGKNLRSKSDHVLAGGLRREDDDDLRS